MHPAISQFPSSHFYENKLLNGDNMSRKSTAFHGTEGLGPYLFYDVVDGRELRGKNSGMMSLSNECEVDAAVEVLKFFKWRYPSEFVGGRIGVVTPYKSQQSLLRSRFSSVFGSSVVGDMEFNTVDGFQGREVDILILSTVRAADPCTATDSSSIGFVADIRRMNVALTRARLSLWIFGNARTLQTNRDWAALVKDAKQRNLIISVKRPYTSMFKTAGERNSVEGDSDDHSIHLKHRQRVGCASQLAEQIKGREKMDFERSGKHVARVAKNSNITTGYDKTATEDVPSNKKRGRNADDSSKRTDLSSTSTNSNNRRSQKKRPAISGETVADGEKLGREDVNKIESLIENRNVNKRKGIKNSHQTSQPVSNESEVNNDGRAGSSYTLISKRKQREAVDAILCSALIPSKKSEQSKISAKPKRPHSPSSLAAGGIKSSKTMKSEVLNK